MKRLLLSLILAVTGFIASFGMSFSEAQQHAYFLTDKMAYELDLTPAQYDEVYQVNLEYLLNVNKRNPYDYYWDYRNADLNYILFDWQYDLYRRAEYFYRPIVWRSHAWHFYLWDRYHRTYYFFNRPTIWNSWHGGLWHGRVHNTPSPFIGHRPSIHNGGMRHDRRPGDHIGGQPGGKPHNNGGSWYNPGNNRPNGGNNGYNRPNNGNNGHQGGYTRPNGGNNTQSGSNARPNGNNNRPNGGYTGGNRGNGGGNMSGSHNHAGGSRGTSVGTSSPSRSTAGGNRSNVERGGGRGAGGHR